MLNHIYTTNKESVKPFIYSQEDNAALGLNTIANNQTASNRKSNYDVTQLINEEASQWPLITETNELTKKSFFSREDSIDIDYYSQITLYRKSNYDIMRRSEEIKGIILNDEYFDGEISQSERYIIEAHSKGCLDSIKEPLKYLMAENQDNTHVLVGILKMISSIPYDDIYPDGQIFAMSLISHKELSVRDGVIQCFEKWNSKKGLNFLMHVKCHPEWFQKYIDNVIMYIERDGIE